MTFSLGSLNAPFGPDECLMNERCYETVREVRQQRNELKCKCQCQYMDASLTMPLRMLQKMHVRHKADEMPK